jgi:protoheme IX farnesyltransferase
VTTDQFRAGSKKALTAPAIARTRAGGVRETACALLALTKPRIVELLLITTVPTMMLADRAIPAVGLMIATVTGGAMAAGGANALNMVYDRDIDATMSRTRRRPLVTGAIAPRTAALFASGLETAAFALLWGVVNLLSALLAVGAAAFYLGVYTVLLKRTTSQNIVIGGAAGAAPVLVGWAAVTGGLSPAAWGLFAVIFLWTPPHFWALAIRFRDDYARAGVPMLPMVAGLRTVANRILGYTVVLAVVSVAVGWLAGIGLPYTAGAAVLGGVFVGQAWRLHRDPSPGQAMRLFRWSIVYLTLLFVLVAVSALVP